MRSANVLTIYKPWHFGINYIENHATLQSVLDLESV